MKPKFSRYNDGIVSIYKAHDNRSAFGAKVNPKEISDLDFIVKLAFSISSKRQQDIEFAEQQGFSLSLKINTRYVSGINNRCKAVIGDYLYDIRYVDSTRTDLYLYLEGVGELD